MHSVVDLPIVEGAIGSTLPFLFLKDGELSIFSLAWARAQSVERAWSPGALHKAVTAVGLFYDFYVIEKQQRPLHPDELFQLVKEFYEARRFGLSSLGWRPVRFKTASDDVRFVSRFTEWCSKNLGLLPVNPVERESLSSLNLGDQRRAFDRFQHRKGWDKLFHLHPSTDEGRGVVEEHRFRPIGRRPRALAGKKHFPPDKVMSLIRATPSVRDKLYLLLLVFGGLRASEPLHLFVTDVRIKPDGVAEVVLGHPETGFYQWVDSVKGKQRGNRASFLAERYFLGPRNRLAFRHPLYAGWKGMALDNGQRHESVVNWLIEDAGRLFARLHAQYMHETRSKVRDNHPYYFVNEAPGSYFGLPVKLSNMSKAFERSAQRIGLSASLDGVNPHGGRHFYGFYCASCLRLPVETTQKLMHHESMLSTMDYYALSAEVARSELHKAQVSQAQDLPTMLRMNDLLMV